MMDNWAVSTIQQSFCTRVPDRAAGKVGQIGRSFSSTNCDQGCKSVASKALPEDQAATSQKQGSQLLATLSTLLRIRRVEFQGLQEAMNKDEVEKAKQNWKHIIEVKWSRA